MTVKQSYFDRYSIPHAAVGALFAASGVPPAMAVLSHVAFEAFEDGLKDWLQPMWPQATHDSMENHIGDIVSFTGGYAFAESTRGTPDGRAASTWLVALGAAVWMYNLLDERSRAERLLEEEKA